MLTTTRRLLALLLVALPLSLQAQGAYPTKPVKLIVPFPPGGNVDLSARILAPELARELGQPVIVENKSGAGGTLGLDAVAKSAPAEYAEFIRSEIVRTAKIVKEAKITLD